ncbi:MAG: succinate dehydrogenase assembly factor 2 [Proteobacteria bacterium]|nr:succinate dehydrogenase assembly factor 2 [Pseudomonadota bacterium]
MTDDATRRRRAHYRAHHRGTKELDWLLGKYAEAHLATMSDAELGAFEELMAHPEPELQKWLMAGELGAESEIFPLVARIRAFHGLDGAAGAQRT